MQQFNIRKNGFEEIKKKVLVRTFFVMAAAITVGITISQVNTVHGKNDVNVLPFVIPLMAAFLGYRMYTGTKKLKKSFESYQLTISDNLITRQQLNLNPLSVSAIEIKEIIKNKDGSFVIKGLTATDIIYVPVQIDNAAELESLLNILHPVIFKNRKPFLQQYPLVLSFVMLALMVGVYTAHNKFIVAISGTLLSAALTWCMYEIRRGKNFDARLKRNIWMLLLVLLSVIGVMIVKLADIGIPAQ